MESCFYLWEATKEKLCRCWVENISGQGELALGDIQSHPSYPARAITDVVQTGFKDLHRWNNFWGLFWFCFVLFSKDTQDTTRLRWQYGQTLCCGHQLCSILVSLTREDSLWCPKNCVVNDLERLWRTVGRRVYLSLRTEATASQTFHAKRISKT